MPLIKFVASEKIMGSFALPWQYIMFAATFGFLLFSMNFVILFSEFGETLKENPLILLGVIAASTIYLCFIVHAIREPVTELKKMTKEEMEDHEYERVEVEDLTPREEVIDSTSS